jgi:hypothetical protein
MRDQMPGEVYDDISTFLRHRGRQAEEGWDSANEDEDTLTGDFGSMLRRRWTKPKTIEGSRWKWRVTYKKLRGRGRDAIEKPSGADGIFRVEVEDVGSGEIQQKCLLFQAKKNGLTHDLIDQTTKMCHIAPGGAAVFQYTDDGYWGYNADLFANNSPNAWPNRVQRLGNFLGGEFLSCEVGLRDVYYDAQRKILQCIDRNGTVRTVRYDVSHRFSIDVAKEPTYRASVIMEREPTKRI